MNIGYQLWYQYWGNPPLKQVIIFNVNLNIGGDIIMNYNINIRVAQMPNTHHSLQDCQYQYQREFWFQYQYHVKPNDIEF